MSNLPPDLKLAKPNTAPIDLAIRVCGIPCRVVVYQASGFDPDNDLSDIQYWIGDHEVSQDDFDLFLRLATVRGS